MNHFNTPTQNIVLVDMDGVLADWEEPNNDIIRRNFPLAQIVKDRRSFYFRETYRDHPEIVATIETESRLPGFFESFPVIEGAIEGWQRILDAGYTPRVCTSPLEDHPTCIPEKKNWLKKHFVPIFGTWVLDTAIFDRDKSGYLAAVIIDDRPTLRSAELAMWQHLVFTRSYNRNVDTKFRLANWYDPSLEGLLEKAKEKYLLRSVPPEV